MSYRARVWALPTATAHEKADQCPDGDLLPVVAVVWLASVARVVGAIASEETFGAEATLAFLATVLLPFPLMRTISWWFRHRGRSAMSERSNVPVLAQVETLSSRTSRPSSMSIARGRPAASESGTKVVLLVPRRASERKRV